VFADTLLTFFNTPLTATQAANIFCWSTVGGGPSGSLGVPFHPPHTHSNSVLSGVFYASVPPGSGAITFTDPRSLFQNKHEHAPAPNTFIVFPSWLTHFVAPTNSDEFRVSFSCNCPGEWEETSDLNLEL
jgi:hypothetical protein